MRILLASPRGFCAGVDRAIEIVEQALERFGPPVYVRHEIVHNRHVVEALKAKGAVFVDDPKDAPAGALLIYSAHGVSPAVREAADAQRLRTIDATCPLVTKVHVEAQRFARDGYEIVLVGHAGHVEVEGTMGHAPERMRLVEDVADVAALAVAHPAKLAVLTQTTLSVDDTREVTDALRARFPQIRLPRKDDICYATQNRQNAVKQLVAEARARARGGRAGELEQQPPGRDRAEGGRVRAPGAERGRRARGVARGRQHRGCHGGRLRARIARAGSRRGAARARRRRELGR